MKKNTIIWVGILLLLFLLFGGNPMRTDNTWEYSQFIEQLQQGRISGIYVDQFVIKGKTKDNISFTTIRPAIADTHLMDELWENGVTIEGAPVEHNIFLQIFINLIPFFIIVGIIYWTMRKNPGMGGSNPFSMGKSKAKLISSDEISTRFKDVAGCDEAKQEVKDIVEFLKDPEKITKLGGRMPKGVLMSGPPGTGKTLLARAIAGESNASFLSLSGSDFVEMFVGVGAARVRDLFSTAKQNTPCIIFIDEIDAIGGRRGPGLGGGHDEREQTLNQILIEMDGFEQNQAVIIIAATNRPDVLDPALLRSGRFDRRVEVDLPTVEGRKEILKVHINLKKVPLESGVDESILARATPGFSGADLENLINEAALLAARNNKKLVNMNDFEKAKDKILMGSERKSSIMSKEEIINTAWHESGHAILGKLLPDHDPIYKVSIIPRGRALGVTMFLPEKDQVSASHQALLSKICCLFGGRVAEEMLNGKMAITTGASNDIQVATRIAKNMVTRWGYSDKLGALFYADQNEYGEKNKISDETLKVIDEEVKSIIDNAYQKAKELLDNNEDKMKAMVDALIKYETINSDQVEDIMNGLTPREPQELL